MFISIWLLTLMIIVIILLLIAIYCLVGFLILFFIGDVLCDDVYGFEVLYEDCYRAINDPSTSKWERLTVEGLFKLAQSMDENKNIPAIILIWPINLMIIRFGSSVMQRKGSCQY